MNNNFRTIKASTSYCKPIPSVEVYSQRYNDDVNYQISINNKINRAYELKRNNTQ